MQARKFRLKLARLAISLAVAVKIESTSASLFSFRVRPVSTISTIISLRPTIGPSSNRAVELNDFCLNAQFIEISLGAVRILRCYPQVSVIRQLSASLSLRHRHHQTAAAKAQIQKLHYVLILLQQHILADDAISAAPYSTYVGTSTVLAIMKRTLVSSLLITSLRESSVTFSAL